MDSNAQMSSNGWIPKEREYSTNWIKITSYGRFAVDVVGEGNRFYPNNTGHALNFGIIERTRQSYFLGKGSEYLAEIREPTESPFTIDVRPMKEDELEDFRRRFSVELADLPDQTLRMVVKQDLDEYVSTALGGRLGRDWERYKSETD